MYRWGIRAKKTVNGEIVELLCRFDWQDARHGKDWRVQKEHAIAFVQENIPYATITPGVNPGEWRMGAPVQVRVGAGGKKYLRTDANNIDADNLGNLPEY